MVILILYSTYPLLKESAMILLQTVPTHIKVDSLQNKLLQEVLFDSLTQVDYSNV